MKKTFVAILLALLCTGAGAQTPRAKDFAEVTDSLQARLKRRTGVESKFKLEKVQVRGKVLDFYFSKNLVGQPFRRGDATWLTEQIQELGQGKLKGYGVGTIYADKQKVRDLAQPLPGNDGKPADTRFRVKDPATGEKPLVKGADTWPLGLSGRHIALWHSHGRYYNEETELWDWQRAPSHRTLEDIYTQSYVLPYLIPMLENAGAVVLTPRERDTQRAEVVCDNDKAFTEGREPGVRTAGKYEEFGHWENAGEGFADKKAVYSGNDAPFKMGTARKTASRSGARAEWHPDIEDRGFYAVYVSYKSLPESTSEARYVVHHLGGNTVKLVNQRMGGGMWIYIGTYEFGRGEDGYVELASSNKGVVTADAVRFGGGMGKVERGGRISGMPAHIEGALYNYQWSGIDLSIAEDWNDDYTRDFASRGAWVKHISGGSRVNPEADGRRIPIDLSLAFHTDAGLTPNDSIVGTLAIYTLKEKGNVTFPDGEDRLSSRLLSDMVQTQVVSDIRATYEPLWTRRETWDRSYSESRTTGGPALLLELLSHQNFADMRYGLDPAFRFTACRAVYKGLLKFLSARYGVPYVVQPLPVRAFSTQLDSGAVVLSWADTRDSLEPTAAAEYYKVYTRMDDGGFDDGKQISSRECRLPIRPGHTYSFRITACNAGGESFPSEVLSVGYPYEGASKVKIINNFTRISAPVWFDGGRFAGFLDNIDSGVPMGEEILFGGGVNLFDREAEYTSNENPGFGGSYDNMAGSKIAGNTFDFVSKHGKAVMDAGYAFDSSSEEAFSADSTAFALDIICGKQVTVRMGSGFMQDRFRVFPERFQNEIRTFTAGGGNVLISGAYIGTDAWSRIYQDVPIAPESTRRFVKEVLGYEWITNFGDAYGLAVPWKGAGLPEAMYNKTLSPYIYKVDHADGIGPASPASSVIMRYKASDIPAATLYNGEGYRVAAFGFPLETSPQMGEIIGNILHSFR